MNFIHVFGVIHFKTPNNYNADENIKCYVKYAVCYI